MSVVATAIEGVAALTRQLKELGDPKAQAATLRAAVRTPMRAVMAKAKANIASFSPGQTDIHRTYKGRMVGAGFAARSIRIKIQLSRDKEAAFAFLGVAPEAFYAVQFFELGTAHIAKQPWLVPAFESSQNAMVQGIATELRKRIERIAKQRGGK
jgi:HK97 gp10 family phage protein